MKDDPRKWKKLYKSMKAIADEALYLANEYSRNESEIAKELSKKFTKLEDKERV